MYVCVCVCVCIQEELVAQGKTVLCVDIDCVMCADFRDLSIWRNVSVLDLKMWALVDFYRSFMCGASVKTRCLFLMEQPLYASTVRPSCQPAHPAHSYSSAKTQLGGHLPSPLKVPSSPTIQLGASPLVSPWAPRHQILPTFPATRIATSSMMCSQCLLTNGSVSDFLTDILGRGLRFYVVIRIRPQCLSA